MTEINLKSTKKNMAIKCSLVALLFICYPTHASQMICGNNEQAQKLAQLILTDMNQQRNDLNCSKKLNEIALIKANIIRQNQDIWHNAGRLTPNQLLRHHNFKLPKTYPLFGNQVEAIAGGEAAYEFVFEDFLNSSPHKKLLLGEDDFFKAQNQMGVAYLKDLDTDHQHYWVVIIADERNQTVKQDPIIEVEPPVISKKRNRGREIKERMYRNKVRGRLN
jgi:uncharacterized protein YkwD